MSTITERALKFKLSKESTRFRPGVTHHIERPHLTPSQPHGHLTLSTMSKSARIFNVGRSHHWVHFHLAPNQGQASLLFYFDANPQTTPASTLEEKTIRRPVKSDNSVKTRVTHQSARTSQRFSLFAFPMPLKRPL